MAERLRVPPEPIHHRSRRMVWWRVVARGHQTEPVEERQHDQADEAPGRQLGHHGEKVDPVRARAIAATMVTEALDADRAPRFPVTFERWRKAHRDLFELLR